MKFKNSKIQIFTPWSQVTQNVSTALIFFELDNFGMVVIRREFWVQWYYKAGVLKRPIIKSGVPDLQTGSLILQTGSLILQTGYRKYIQTAPFLTPGLYMILIPGLQISYPGLQISYPGL